MRYLTLLPVYDYAGSWNLKGDDARLNVGPYSMLSGNINVQDKGTVTLGGKELSPDLTLQNQMLYSLFNGYRNTEREPECTGCHRQHDRRSGR